MNDCLVRPIESRVATMPRVLFVTPRFHPYPGGYENYVTWLAKSLRKTGARVSVFTATAFDLEA